MRRKAVERFCGAGGVNRRTACETRRTGLLCVSRGIGACEAGTAYPCYPENKLRGINKRGKTG